MPDKIQNCIAECKVTFLLLCHAACASGKVRAYSAVYMKIRLTQLPAIPVAARLSDGVGLQDIDVSQFFNLNLDFEDIIIS